MLTIKNYYKICQRKLDIDEWDVSFCSEEKSTFEYVFGLRKQLFNGLTETKKVQLSRIPIKVKNAGDNFMFKYDGISINVGVTADWIADIDNMIKVLTIIVEKYYK